MLARASAPRLPPRQVSHWLKKLRAACKKRKLELPSNIKLPVKRKACKVTDTVRLTKRQRQINELFTGAYRACGWKERETEREHAQWVRPCTQGNAGSHAGWVCRQVRAVACETGAGQEAGRRGGFGPLCLCGPPPPAVSPPTHAAAPGDNFPLARTFRSDRLDDK